MSRVLRAPPSRRRGRGGTTSERWVLRRIYAGKFRAIKVGRSCRMTEEQLDEALAALEIKPTTPPSGLTRTSQRRRQRRS
jgi:hypothetical protein